MPPTPLVWRQIPVRHVFEVVYPAYLRDLPESEAARELAQCDSLEYTLVPRSTEDRTPFGELVGPFQGALDARPTGPVGSLAECLRNYWVQTATGSSVDETVRTVARAIDYASELLVGRVGGPAAGEESDPPATHALIWLNALLFQELLSAHLETGTLAPAYRDTRIESPDSEGRPSEIREQWKALLEINWWPIFAVALHSLDRTSPYWARLALAALSKAAAEVAEGGVIRRHDIAGRVFHRLLESRKFLGTNYTTVPAAVMLAGLAVDRKHPRWNGVEWDSEAEVASLRIVDPACESGTLLMAVVQEVLKRHRRADGSDESQGAVIEALLESALYGFDVVPAAVRLTAATLSMSEAK